MKKKIIFIILLLNLIFWPQAIFAQESTYMDGLDIFGDYTVLPSGNLEVIVSRIINVFIGLAGIFLVGIFLYAGVTWMVALGNEEKVKLAKDTIIQATIGLVIMVTSYSIAQFLLNAIYQATS
ncbi:MAG: hypothetical protein NTZ49_00350 [Candidatus Parcubacteria bacterium]|nr:hypothetical protein [Candidatus Parcubacteria bacterium]